MSIISQRIRKIKLSPSVAARAIIADLRAKGREIIDLTIGEPNFKTPDHICEAAYQAMLRGETGYPPAQGNVELRKAAACHLKNDTGIDYALDQVIISTGAKQCIYNGLAASLDDDDEVIIPAPYWVSYPDMVIVNNGKPVFISTGSNMDFKFTAEQLENAITPKTRWLMLNCPSNPAGTIYSAQELSTIADVLRKHPHVWVMTDDIYASLRFSSDKIIHLLKVAPDLAERTLVVNGVSKAYAMTGWRIGYAAGPRELIKAMATLQSQSTSGACSISQAAAIEALNGPQDCVIQMANAYVKRRDLAIDILSAVEDLKIVKPEGAFYLFPDATKIIGKRTASNDILLDDDVLVNTILKETGVALISGSAYGQPGSFRLSFAISDDFLKRGCQKIVAFCQALKQ